MNIAATAPRRVTTAPAATPDPDLAVKITGLVKTFGHVRAVDDIDLTVHPGEIVAFLGPNGAGKSTKIGRAHV